MPGCGACHRSIVTKNDGDRAWFTESFDTADLQEAKALLEELA
jgi:hypothetical protein